MTTARVRKLDFGPLQIEETLYEGSTLPGAEGRRLGRIELVGPFDGQEEGSAGKAYEYFPTLPGRFDLLVVVLARTKYVNDLGPELLKRLKDRVRERGGNVVLAAPPKKVAIVLEFLGFSYAPDEETAFAELDSLG